MTSEEFKKRLEKIRASLPGDSPYLKTYSLTIKSKFEGENIITFFKQKFSYISSSIWVEKVLTHNLLVNHKPITTKYTLRTGDLVTHSTQIKREPLINPDVELIFDSTDYSIINKPSPLPMHGCGRYLKNTLENILKLGFPEQSYKIVHRLDSNTTGLVILAKNKNTATYFNNQFATHQITKTYLAWVEGNTPKTFKSEVSIAKTKTSGGKRTTILNELSSETHFKKLESTTTHTLLEISPKTGRTNQIRLHLAEIGYPIVGDQGYKDQSYFKNNPFTYPTDSMYLHAWKLNFNCPINSKNQFEAIIPEKFKKFREQ